MVPIHGVVAALVGGALLVPSPSGGTRYRCPVKHVRQLNAEAVTYVSSRSYVACLRKTGRRTRVGEVFDATAESADSGNSGIVAVKLVGHFVLTIDVTYDQTSTYDALSIINVQTRKTNYSDGVGGDASSGAGISGASLGQRGSVIYLRASAERQDLLTHDLGGTRVLDSGPDIDPRSLSIDGHVARWSHGSESRSATLDN